MSKRTFAALAIKVAGTVGAAAVAWQAVRVCQGTAGVPIVDAFFESTNAIFGNAPPTGPFAEFIASLMRFAYCMVGITEWCVFAMLLFGVVSTIARIVEVGWDQYSVEARSAAEERYREDRVMERWARREARREQAELEKRPKSGFPFGALALGIIIGRIL